jgi:hypothetical protein
MAISENLIASRIRWPAGPWGQAARIRLGAIPAVLRSAGAACQPLRGWHHRALPGKLSGFRQQYNTRRPHSMLRYQSPANFAALFTPSLAPVGLRPPFAKDGQPPTDTPTSSLPDQPWPWSNEISPVTFLRQPSTSTPAPAMDIPQPLDSLFKEKLFRIPDYQRGYAWQVEQLKAFWEDLVNLPDDRSHYTGVLTLKAIPQADVPKDAKEFWLIDDHSYQLYHIVDGQQRLTTFVVMVQAILEFVHALPENAVKPESDIYLTESLSLADVAKKYLFETKPTGDQFRTYKFGYVGDRPSNHFFCHRIMGEAGGGTIDETFYTLNLSNAKHFFTEQLVSWHSAHGLAGIQDVYRKLTKRFLFNEYIIRDEFDVFVAFETMNNRGKRLSDLELLKNRLIYLTTLYTDHEMDPADRRSLREAINDAWKEVYHQLGRNRTQPLNDDDFLRAHWILYFKYSRQTGRDYIRFLLEEQFTPQRVHKKIADAANLEATEEVRAENDEDETESTDVEPSELVHVGADLNPGEIREYITSLKDCGVLWFNTFFPEYASEMSALEREWIARLNRIGIGYFRPLVMAALKSVPSETDRLQLFQTIERFIFIVFRLNSAKSNYGSSEFSNAARSIDRRSSSIDDVCAKLDERLRYAFAEDGCFRIDEFHSLLIRRFTDGAGYYGWSGLRYFLYEYELSLLAESRQKKVDWADLLRSERDMISIEHIYPQTETATWNTAFSGVEENGRKYYRGGIGNLLLLSCAINSSLQNDSYDDKKNPRFDPSGRKIRNGYSDGSHSEIEVASRWDTWGPEQIRERGLHLLRFMEKRWLIRFRDEDRERLLFQSTESNIQSQVGSLKP